jgi:cytochrome c oxidase assembly protein subunit 15
VCAEVRTPLGFAAAHLTLGPRSLSWSSTVALVFSILIVFTGGIVRVTGSGLGCPTWPTCDADSLAPTAGLGINGLIEFSNRIFTAVIVLAIAWVIISARLQKPVNRSLARLAWSQFWLVVLNAFAGGITVLTGLNPWLVAAHFLLAMALLATTTLTWHRTHERRTASTQTVPPKARAWTAALLIATVVLIVVGTAVTGSGPHSGAASALDRMGFDWTTVTIVHGCLAVAVLALACVLWFVLAVAGTAPMARNRAAALIGIVLAQGAIGIVQALNGLPDFLVALHLLGVALVWAGTLRVVLDVEPRLLGVSPIRTEVRANTGAEQPRTQTLRSTK